MIIGGGEHVTALPEFTLTDCPALDYCGMGEGEDILLDFVQTVRSDGDLSRVAGLFKFGNRRGLYGQRHENEYGKSTTFHGRLGSTAYRSLSFQQLRDGRESGAKHADARNARLPLSMHILFESRHVRAALLYAHPEDIIQEMMHYIESYKATFFEFYDLTAIIRKDWLVKFCNLYLRNNLKVSWSLPSGTRSEALDAEALALLHQDQLPLPCLRSGERFPGDSEGNQEAGQTGPAGGIGESCGEAGNQYTLQPDHRLPEGETTSQILETLRFQAKLAWIGVEDAPIYMFSPYPGSALFEQLRESRHIGELDDAYFDTLLAQMDLGVTETYCESVPARCCDGTVSWE